MRGARGTKRTGQEQRSVKRSVAGVGCSQEGPCGCYTLWRNVEFSPETRDGRDSIRTGEGALWLQRGPDRRQGTPRALRLGRDLYESCLSGDESWD